VRFRSWHNQGREFRDHGDCGLFPAAETGVVLVSQCLRRRFAAGLAGNGTPAALQLAADKTNLVAVDGTDDAQLIVTVRDANGNAISNNVPINLSILSGPGEFPTGTNITFTPPSSSPQSDIAIRDGKAALNFAVITPARRSSTRPRPA